jgi:pimeloyl-ACP methyl ester carboxylesterase
VQYETYNGATEMPYRLQRQPGGSDRLFVFFPRLRPQGAAPNAGLSGPLADIRAHHLMLGADEHLYVGPERRMLGRKAAVALIRQERDRLGVAPENVTTIGTSMGGIMALLVGLPAGAGHIIAGGAPIKMGKTLEKFDRLEGPSSPVKAAATAFIALAEKGDGRAIPWLNRIIFKEARKVDSRVRVDLFGSELDRTMKPMKAFAEAFAGSELVDVRLTVEDYGRHSEIHEPFLRFARTLLAR